MSRDLAESVAFDRLNFMAACHAPGDRRLARTARRIKRQFPRHAGIQRLARQLWRRYVAHKRIQIIRARVRAHANPFT